jgi:hypothetical protein
MKKTFSLILKISGILFIGISLLCAWATFSAYLERSRYGAGLMFADAEILLLLTVVFLLLGIIFIWIGKKIKS